MSSLWLDNLAPQEWHSEAYRDVFQTFRNVDWSEIIGSPIHDFPAALRIMVCQCFAMDLPAVIHWGSTLVQIYNAAFLDTVVKENHPETMGQRWFDSWSTKLPDIESHQKSLLETFKTGKSVLAGSTPYFGRRNDRMEEVAFSHSTSAIRDAEGHIQGLFSTLNETTDVYLATRRAQVMARIQEARSVAATAQEIFDVVTRATQDNPFDYPCIVEYHCNEPLVEASERTYSKVVCVGALASNLPEVVRSKDSVSWQDRPEADRDIEDYFLEVLHTKRPVKLTTANIISKFCTRRAFGDLTETIWMTPIFCLGHSLPAGISLQGLNPRRPQDEDLVVRQLSLEIELCINSASNRVALAQALQVRTAELAVSQKRLRIMAEACPAGIYIRNMTTGEFEFVNDAYFEITGIPKEVGISHWEDYVHPEIIDDAKRTWDDLENKPITNYETRWITPWRGDIERWTSSSAVMHEDDAGNKFIFGAFSDSSAIKYALKVEKERADAAIKTKQQQQEFLDMIAHELRNPLGAIIQSSDFLVDKLTQGMSSTGFMKPHIVKEDDVEDLRTIVLCAQHMSRIINDTLNLSKLEGGMLIATHVPTQPMVVMKSILAMFDAEAQRNGTKLELDVDPSFRELDIDWIQTDPSRLSQIIINLLANSIKFVSRMKVRQVKITLAASITPMATRVTLDRRPSFPHHSSSDASYRLVSCTHEDRPVYIICRISDTGPGMSEEQVSSLFQRYFQASPKTHVEYGGSGLGLFISKQLVTLLNGTIDVESVRGRGTTFSFSIRSTRCDAPLQVAESTDFPEVINPDEKSTKDIILIAEDNLINQKIMVKQLTNAGYTTLVANNGQEAIDILLEDQSGPERICMCLCDVEMPVMNGIETIKEVRKLELTKKLRGHCPFIAVTANARQEQVSEMLAAGMDDSMPKPFRFDALIAKMVALLSRLGKSPIQPFKQSASVTSGTNAAHMPAAASFTSLASDTSTSAMTKHRTVSELWSNNSSKGLDPFHVILLNTPPPSNIAAAIWTRASHQSDSLKVCADGATDRLHEQVYNSTLESLDIALRPDVVLGDLDSVRAATKAFYESTAGTKVIQIEDQNSTDFTKAVKYIEEHSSPADIVVIGGIGGRLDQTFSTLNTLTKFPNQKIYVVDEDNLVILLFAGSHEIACAGLGRHCGLVPLCAPVRCWSTGFEWCLNGETMDIGELISTNNRVVSEDAMLGVTCDGPILFSIELIKT
ncbi:protein of unknown function [Taphrina deformans PYCC 5710]|uniref:histidine kinase n=1 Tax=Taphrina deformans (strain PYCC 5710 / ATCC 11124 / CBS 356.35 / IMI 108563 / JCM 9778 / NBRC 8474) TaxID=1097556 RepID=R4XEF1_TAPDE|nr:protein of unknown function [Taphrina deformans PYCC 5710]|eukprot:CCG84217.1 protein of unknown function [Taphrina deformans PYCC 5710]